MTSDDRVRSGTILVRLHRQLVPLPRRGVALTLGLEQPMACGSRRVPIASAGTSAAIGQPIPLSFASRLATVGAETSAFAPRQVTREMVAGAELVIAATRAHRATLVEMHPRAVHYTFTLRELARLAVAVPPDDQAPVEPLARLRSFVASAASARGAGMPGDPNAEDVRDPWGGNDARYASVWDTLVEATSADPRCTLPGRCAHADVRGCAVAMTAQLTRPAPTPTRPRHARARSAVGNGRLRALALLLVLLLVAAVAWVVYSGLRAKANLLHAADDVATLQSQAESGNVAGEHVSLGKTATRSALGTTRDSRTDLAARTTDAHRRQQRCGDHDGRGSGRRPCSACTAVTCRRIGRG